MIAIDAIDRSSGARLEGDLGFLSAFTAFYGEELAGSRRGKGSGSFLYRSLRPFSGAGSSASRASLGRMIMAFGLESLLFLNSENVGCFAIEAD